MKTIKRTLTVPAVLMCMALTAVIGFQVAAAAIAMATPTVVVTVDLPAAFQGLNQRAEMEAKLESMRAEMGAEETRRQEQLEAKQKQYKDLAETDVKGRQALNEEMTLMALEFNAWLAFANEQVDIEKSLLLRDLDRKVRSAIEELAAINGYEIVMNDDSKQELSIDMQLKVPREIQVKQQMTSRRLLYVNPSRNITEELIERMNNAFAAGG